MQYTCSTTSRPGGGGSEARQLIKSDEEERAHNKALELFLELL